MTAEPLDPGRGRGVPARPRAEVLEPHRPPRPPRAPDGIPPAVTLVAVSKTVPRTGPGSRRGRAPRARREPGPGGGREDPARGGALWHLIGPLQANKARRAVELFDVIETVTRSRPLGGRPDRRRGAGGRAAARPAPGQRGPRSRQGGLRSRRRVEARDRRSGRPEALDLRGLMTIGRFAVDRPRRPGATFARSAASRRACAPAGRGSGPELSMGMTDDYQVAVEEGATIVRVGRALFGERPAPQRRPGGRAARTSGPPGGHPACCC